ncbi:MAG TPA: FMN-binding protein [Pseudonocardiaceae bacterium]|jgi:uncharacterized protein with FMN-binding domain
MTDDTRTRLRRTGGLAALVAGIGLVVGLKAAAGESAPRPVALPPAVAPTPASPTATSSGAAAPPAPTSPATSSATSRVVPGDVAQTPYGPVQVALDLTGKRIVDVRALQLPSAASRSRRIAAVAAPQLRTEVLSAQSGQIDTVSGATYTSQGYAESVQYAIDHE